MTAEEYRDRLIATIPALAPSAPDGRFPSRADLRAAAEIGYAAMLQNPDVRAAARAVRAYLQAEFSRQSVGG